MKTINQKEYEKQWRLENKDRVALCAKKYREKRKNFFSKYHREYSKKWEQENKEKRKEEKAIYYLKNKHRILLSGNVYRKKRMKHDICFKLKIYLRNRIRFAIKTNAKTGSAVRDLGCTIEYLKSYLEKKFINGMTWDNWGINKNEWSIDHIRPLSKIDLTKKPAFLSACHYTNLQPMWHTDNVKKGNK